MLRLINIGFGNMIAADRIIAIVSPDSAPVKRMIQEARDLKRVIDATQGRRTRAVIQTDSEEDATDTLMALVSSRLGLPIPYWEPPANDNSTA